MATHPVQLPGIKPLLDLVSGNEATEMNFDREIREAKPKFSEAFNEEEVKAMGKTFLEMISDLKKKRQRVFSTSIFAEDENERPTTESDKEERTWKLMSSERCEDAKVSLFLNMRVYKWEPEMRHAKNRLDVLHVVFEGIAHGVPECWLEQMRPMSVGWEWGGTVRPVQTKFKDAPPTEMEFALEVLDERPLPAQS